MIEAIVVPILATILYIMPVYAYYRVPQLKRYRNTFLDSFIALVGVIAISGFLVGKLFN